MIALELSPTYGEKEGWEVFGWVWASKQKYVISNPCAISFRVMILNLSFEEYVSAVMAF